MATGLMLILVGVGIGFCVLLVRTFSQWSGVWRWAAAIPLLLILSVVFNIVTEIRLDPTAHNLWPIELLAWFCIALVCVGILYLLRWISHRFTA